MKAFISATASAAVLGLAFAVPAVAQTTTTTGARTTGGTGITMPYERNFWGHVGASLGRAELDGPCFPGTGCDDTDRAWRIYGGGKFNNMFGGEVGWVQFGDFSTGGGTDTRARGLDLALIAGIPFANNWSLFGKLGTVYGRTRVRGPAGLADLGKEDGWGPRIGVGLQMGLTPNWAVRVDLDRYRFKFPGGRENIDALMIGAQYSFGPPR